MLPLPTYSRLTGIFIPAPAGDPLPLPAPPPPALVWLAVITVGFIVAATSPSESCHFPYSLRLETMRLISKFFYFELYCGCCYVRQAGSP